MTFLESILPHVVAFMLVVCRIGGVLFGPLLSSVMLPAQAKAVLVFALAGAVYPVLPVEPASEAPVGVFGLLPLVAMELAIGLVVGTLASLPMLALEMAGQIMSHQTGLGLARVYNPEADAETDVLGQVMFYLGIAIFVSLGGVEAMFGALASSFERVPLGGLACADMPLQTLVGVVSSGLELSLRVSAPVTAIVFLILVAMGIVGKSMSQLNVMTVGFALKILAAILILSGSLMAVHEAASEEIRSVFDGISAWIDGLGRADGSLTEEQRVAEDMGERTEQPTGRKLGRARSRGQTAKSQDLAAAVIMLSGLLILAIFGSRFVDTFATVMRRVLEGQTPGEAVSVESVAPAVAWASVRAATVLGPAMALLAIIAYLSHYVQVGWLVTTYPLKPNFGRLNPAAGLKKLFGKRNLGKTVVSFGKLLVVVLVATLVIRRDLEKVVSLPLLAAHLALYRVVLMMFELALWLLLIFLLIGVLDWMYQKWQHRQDLRMTKQEVKDERRMLDGDPAVKARRYRMAQKIAYQRIMAEVPKADVVVTNPTHFAVALRYDQSAMRAPRLTAKGADLLAYRVREIASAHGIPIVERPPLARALYWNVEVGHEISPEHYEAVAEVLAYVYRLREQAAAA